MGVARLATGVLFLFSRVLCAGPRRTPLAQAVEIHGMAQ
jgi:hypothetical protein